ncbi:hypothetical protein EMA8858_02565 [Emticicia aquatica]|uniref:Uncharacterized protein n=1 Tax=Emticicia aquatica TaxID=1681835 RepID=A0ABM9AR54_9BACT|nr:hypothetical protein [Emticicia aquatica]CAH0996433.1 hypothetical protein EMA8858_02565 [Emticicia aquatica]
MNIKSSLGKIILVLLTPIFALAHIGSAGVVHEGKAGNYQVQVYVEPPDVIPGTAKVSVMVDGNDITSVKMSPIFYWTGDEGSPRSDEGILTEIGKYEGKIWLMESGAASVKVTIEGARGKGDVLIPIAALSTAQRQLPSSLGWILAGLALLLIGIMTTIIGASTGDSLLKVGQAANESTKKRRLIGSTIGASFCGLILFGGNMWWNSESANYQRFMYQPYTATSKISFANGQRILSFKIDTASVKGRLTSFIIPDHGKLMHLFLVKEGSMDVFAHLHPSRKDSITFEAPLPNMPGGKYLIYADVLRFHSLQNTITDTVEIPSPPKVNLMPTFSGDSDDTFVVTNAINKQLSDQENTTITICGTPGVKTKLQDGSSIVWNEKPNEQLQMGKVYDLKFSVVAPDGKPAELQTYLGMMGHAAVIKDDGSVYIHLHPNGTFSTTAVQVMQNRIDATINVRPNLNNPKRFKDSVDNVLSKLQAMTETERDKFLMGNMKHESNGHHSGEVAFPYVFPKAGNYRIWVQVKREGKILTGVFDAKVI